MRASEDPGANAVSHLVRSLYTDKELELEWDLGFRGHPSIGAPVMARIGTEIETRRPPWAIFEDRMRAAVQGHRNVRLLVIGSLFGATGSSGFPILPRILRSHSVIHNWGNPRKLLVGGVALLPYFNYEIPPERRENLEVYADPQFFLLNTKSTLGYYAMEYQQYSPFNAIYFLGESAGQTSQEFAVGGQPQRNLAHFVDLLGALGATHFFSSPAEQYEDANTVLENEGIVAVPSDRVNFLIAGRDQLDCLSWKDLPDSSPLQNKLVDFLSTAIAIQSFYYPLVNDKRFTERPQLSPWYYRDEHFKKSSLSGMQARNDFQTYFEYVRLFARWLYEIHDNSKVKVNLLTERAKEHLKLIWNGPVETPPHLDSGGIFNLLVGDYHAVKGGYGRIWDEFCGSEMTEFSNPVARLCTSLYQTISRLNRDYYGRR